MNIKNSLRALLLVNLLLTIGFAQSAPSPPPETCDEREAREEARWEQSPHSGLSNVFHNEHVGIKDSFCRIHETRGKEKVYKIEDFGRNLFTGEGLHPAVGGIVPGSGLAVGGALNLEGNSASLPLRFNGSGEARGSINGFWVAGGQLEITGSAGKPENQHNHFVIAFEHHSLPQLTYYGLGNASAADNKTLYGLQVNKVNGTLEISLPKSFTVVGITEGLWITQEGFHGSSTPSIEQKFTSADTPGLNTHTAYFVYGAGIHWNYPAAKRLRGYRTEVAARFRAFHETSGAPYSFRRFDVNWSQHYTPENAKLGTLSLLSRLVISGTSSTNQVPFYLQPTLGGTDIENQADLRSYKDYRFRDPNLLSFQAEYERGIWGPIGGLFFYDVGKVAVKRSDLALDHLRHSFGVGMTLRVGDVPYLRLYFAWGGKEGTHTNVTGNTNNLGYELKGVF